MSNIKDFVIEAKVPWCWPGELDLEDFAVLGGLILTGGEQSITCRQENLGYEPNNNGGDTMMVNLAVYGREAVPWKKLKRIVSALAGLDKAEILRAEGMDVEDRSFPPRMEKITYEPRAPIETL